MSLASEPSGFDTSNYDLTVVISLSDNQVLSNSSLYFASIISMKHSQSELKICFH